MDASFIFRQGLGTVIPRPPQHFFSKKPHIPAPHPHDDADSDNPHRIAHTLTACCRCRQRKTRCDPNLPRCSPCDRSGSTCEYFDTTKGKKISRFYVVKLQEKVRQLEADLARLTDDDNERDREVRLGGLVRLNETDETPRYLGPSSGIAMTRLLMQEAKRYTDSKTIAELIPEVRARRLERTNRMQSVVSMAGSISGPSGRKKSFPMTSEHPAQGLPSRNIADKLMEVFNQRAQMFTPTLHEKAFADDLDAVYNGDDTDPYKNFVVRMVTAISLQKVDAQYAGLADSYYLAAMQYFEDIVRPKDLKTLQCLILIGQYSLLTPTRTAVYYVIGLATRICQQMGLGEEKTIALGITDPQALDMRRRLSWIVATNEFGLAQTMGRPNGFAKGDDLMDVKFFETVDDENITPDGIRPGPVSEKKMVSIHFCKMRLLQAEIRRVLYEKKRPEPDHENHPWFSQMERKLEEWRDSAPEKPEWCKPWFTGRYHTMIVTLYRPNPQVPKPSNRAALKCFDGANYVISLSSQQLKRAAIDITWVFLLTIYMSLNTLLWTLSYSEVRAQHSREELEALVNTAVEIVDQCSERWPGSASAAQLYAVFAKACMQSYEMKEEPPTPPATGVDSTFNTPPSLVDPSSPDSDSTTTASSSQQAQSQSSMLFNSANPFGYVFGATPEDMSTQYSFDTGPSPFQNHPTFRSNSIFFNPGTDSNARRGSYFPPDFTHASDSSIPEGMDDSTLPGTVMSQSLSPPMTVNTPMTNALPTPPESLAPPSVNSNNNSLSPQLGGLRTASPTPTPTMTHASPAMPLSHQASPVALPPPGLKYEHSDYSQRDYSQPDHTQLSHMKQQRSPGGPPRATAQTFTIPPPPQANHPQQQRGVPTTVTDWFSPPPPFISPHAFSGGMNPGYWGDGTTPTPFAGLGLSGGESYAIGGGRNGIAPQGGGGSSGGAGDGADFSMFTGSSFPAQYPFSQQRHGSLSQEQQVELMQVLETDGMTDIDTFLSAGMGLGGGGIDGVLRWE